MPVAAHGIAFQEELSRHLPPGFTIEVDGEWLHVVGPDGPLGATTAHWLMSDVLLEDEAIEGAIGSLDFIQSEVAEETTEPWPATSGPRYAGFPEPDGQLVADDLDLWFGPKDAPIVKLAPISLRGVVLKA